MEQSIARAKRVLIIEDYCDSAEVLCIVLRHHGHAVEVARSGTEGLQRAQASSPDVIVCDIGLPDIDGLALARTIRADPRLNDVWLIALTAFSLPEEALAAGFDEYLTKPADFERLALHLLEQPPPRKDGPV